MKQLLIAGLLLGCACSAQAQSAASVIVKDDADQTATSLSAAQVNGRNTVPDRFCVRETGSRIAARRNARTAKADQPCLPVNGRSYTREDLDRTGSTDIAEALRKLDPSIR